MMNQRGWFVFIICLGIITPLIIEPVIANPTPRTRSLQLFFEKDGHPLNESVNFSIDCLGFFAAPYYQFMYNESVRRDVPRTTVFRISGNCPSYGCFFALSTRSPPDPYWEPEQSKLCRINGSISSQPFTDWNITGLSGIQCAKRSDQWDVEKKVGRITHYYNYSPEYYSCRKNLDALVENCQNIFRNSSSGYGTNDINQTYLECRDLDYRQEFTCDSNLVEINISKTNPAQYSCIFRFDISSGNMSTGSSSEIEQTVNPHHSPVESLWCSLLRLIGKGCE
jgi:hypothetical protein